MFRSITRKGFNPGSRRLLVAVLLIGSILVWHLRSSAGRPGELRPAPPVILWSWERREDLSFIDPKHIAVAYLARTLELSGDRVIVRPRLDPLTVPTHTILIPVARIEIDYQSPPSFSSAQRAEAARTLAALALAASPAIQIDFDATASQRAFYRDLLADVRARLPSSTRLSITALASWCVDDNWIAGLPVDEIVPMLYRMGRDGPHIIAYLRDGGDFSPARARTSIGISTDYPAAGLAHGKRLYLFSPHRWTRTEVDTAIQEATR